MSNDSLNLAESAVPPTRVGTTGPGTLAGVEPTTDERLGLLYRFAKPLLDRIDQGVVVLGVGGQLVLANRCAETALHDHPCLERRGTALAARQAADAAAWSAALAKGLQQGLCSLVGLGRGAQRRHVALLPFEVRAEQRLLLCLLDRDAVGSPLSMQWYAQNHGLTGAESSILRTLCEGLRPSDIARRHGVALSTVRSQIGAIRGKTGASSIRGVVESLARLPPMGSQVSLCWSRPQRLGSDGA